MSKHRRTTNPAKSGHDMRSMEQAASPKLANRRFVIGGRLGVALLCVLTPVLLTLCFAPLDCWMVAYLALVPWTLAITTSSHRKWEYLWAWLAGVAFWAGNLYWLWWVTLVGYFTLVLYLSAYWLMAAVMVRAAFRRNMPMWLTLPVVWVALEYARAYVLSGFPWFYLAHSQYLQPRLIQIADVTGQYGVSFFVAMVNGAIAEVLASLLACMTGGPRIAKRAVVGLCVCAAAAAGLMGYGSFRMSQQATREGPALGVVQCAFRISLQGKEKSPEEILDAHLSVMQGLEGSQCAAILMPETMAPPGLNDDLLHADVGDMDSAHLRSLAGKFISPGDLAEIPDDELRELMRCILRDGFTPKPGKTPPPPPLLEYARRLADASRRMGCPVMIGGSTLHYNAKPAYAGDEWLARNSVLWFDEFEKSSAVYSKMHLVPFSEYVPLKHDWPWMHRLMRSCVPSAMSQVEPGDQPGSLQVRRDGQSWLLAPVICYEGTFDRVCRRIVKSAPDGDKSRLVLVNLSNDGWFVRQGSDGVGRASTEQSQHLSAYVFRAIENRVPVVRAVNTGVSGSIDSNGRIVAVLTHNDQRTMVNGTLALDGLKGAGSEYAPSHGPKVLVDGRTSPYSLVGDVFAAVVSLAAGSLAIVLLWKRLRRPMRSRQ